MKIYELTKAVDEKDRLDRAILNKAQETYDRYAPQVITALYNPGTQSYRTVTFNGRFAYSTETAQKGVNAWESVHSIIVSVKMKRGGLLKPKKPVLHIEDNRSYYDNNIIWLSEVVKYLMEREV